MNQQKPLNILNIDDDDVNNFILEKLIRRLEPDVVINVCHNGEAGIDHLLNLIKKDENYHDFIFVDVAMPVMNGWEFVKKFEEIKSQLGKKIAVYIISSSVDLRDIAAAKNNLSVSDYILKPINGEQLTNVFNALDTNPDLKKYN